MSGLLSFDCRMVSAYDLLPSRLRRRAPRSPTSPVARRTIEDRFGGGRQGEGVLLRSCQPKDRCPQPAPTSMCSRVRIGRLPIERTVCRNPLPRAERARTFRSLRHRARYRQNRSANARIPGRCRATSAPRPPSLCRAGCRACPTRRVKIARSMLMPPAREETSTSQNLMPLKVNALAKLKSSACTSADISFPPRPFGPPLSYTMPCALAVVAKLSSPPLEQIPGNSHEIPSSGRSQGRFTQTGSICARGS